MFLFTGLSSKTILIAIFIYEKGSQEGALPLAAFSCRL